MCLHVAALASGLLVLLRRLLWVIYFQFMRQRPLLLRSNYQLPLHFNLQAQIHICQLLRNRFQFQIDSPAFCRHHTHSRWELCKSNSHLIPTVGKRWCVTFAVWCVFNWREFNWKVKYIGQQDFSALIQFDLTIANTIGVNSKNNLSYVNPYF